MPTRLGNISIARNRKDYTCFYCEKTIQKNTDNFVVAGRIRAKVTFWVTSRLHPECFDLWVKEKYSLQVEYANNPPAKSKPEIIKGKLFDLTPAQRKRRAALLFYLNSRDKVNLINAYKRQSTDRVYTVMETMAKRLIEIQESGVDYQYDFDGELLDLVKTHDRWWYTTFDTPHIGSKIASLTNRANKQEPYIPTWPQLPSEETPHGF